MPDFLTPHADALALMTLIVFLMLLQGFVGAFFRNAVEKYQPGERLPANHASATFRQVRSFENSAENTPVFFAAFLLAVFTGASAELVWWTTMIFLIGRIGHWLFYSLNMPVLRTASFAAGAFAMLALGAAAAISAFGNAA